jgi:hypothetical protein
MSNANFNDNLDCLIFACCSSSAKLLINMKIKWLITLSICFLRCAGQESSLPISVQISLDKEYELVRSRDFYAQTIRDNDYVVNSDSVTQKYYDISLEVRNNSNKAVSVWLMRCSYEDNFIINNNYIFGEGHACDSNYPVLIKFNPGEMIAYKMTLKKSIKFDYPCKNCVYGKQVDETRLGLIIIDDIYNPKIKGFEYDLVMGDKSKWKIVWSNSLQLLGKQPEPKFIPFKK